MSATPSLMSPIMIFEGCLDSNPECCRSKLARYRLPFLQKHVDQVDTDPQYFFKGIRYGTFFITHKKLKSASLASLLLHLICRPSFRVGPVPSVGDSDSDPLARDTDPDPSFPHKGVERTEIMLSKNVPAGKL